MTPLCGSAKTPNAQLSPTFLYDKCCWVLSLNALTALQPVPQILCRTQPPDTSSSTDWSVIEDAWAIMETNRFFAKHSTTLTLPTPLPDVQIIHVEATTVSGGKGSTNLEVVSLLLSCLCNIAQDFTIYASTRINVNVNITQL